MALTKCKECGNKVSTKAKACPDCGAPIKKKVGCGGIIFAGLFALICFSVVMGGLEKGSTTSKSSNRKKSHASDKTKSSEAEYTTARKLATIDANTYVAEDDITVKRFESLLNRISSKCTNSKEDIANVLVKVQQVLQDNYGVNVKLMELAETGNQSLPDEAQNIDFAEVMAILMQQYK